MNILICGDRNWKNKKIIENALKPFMNPFKLPAVIHGNCSGADVIGGEVAAEFGCRVIPCPADWKAFGKAAGPIRNQQMLHDWHPHIVLAFHGSIAESKGTIDMIRRANEAGIEVRLYSEASHA